jgi:CRISPR-associated protein Cst2
LSGITHVVGTILIEAPGSFLNGGGIEAGEDRNVTAPKYFRDASGEVPYVSAQAWRRWLRNTLIEETGWKPSELRAVGARNAKGNVAQISSELNPAEFPEDDIFGYMMARSSKKSEGQDGDVAEDETEEPKEKRGKVKSTMRASPLSTSLLVSIQTRKLPTDEGFVHLKEGTPLPYSTRFYKTHLQGIFSLNYSRLGRFENVGDRIELDDDKARNLLTSKTITIAEDLKEHGKKYQLVDQSQRKVRAQALLDSLARLRGGAKQAQFATDVSPKAAVLAGLSCGNPIFNQLFESSEEGPILGVAKLKEIVSDYSDRILTPVFIGLRVNYLKNESEVRALGETEVRRVPFKVGTVIDAFRNVGELLP